MSRKAKSHKHLEPGRPVAGVAPARPRPTGASGGAAPSWHGAFAVAALVLASCNLYFEVPLSTQQSPPAWGAQSQSVAARPPQAAPPPVDEDTPPPAAAMADGEDPISIERRIKLRPTIAEPRFTEPLVPRHQTRAIVLLYHSIDHSLALRTVWPWDFAAQVKRLRESHVEIIKLSQLIAFLAGDIERLPARVAVVTLDDGAASFMKYGWPVALKYRVPFTLSIITKPTELAEYVRALSWTQLRQMVDTGLCEIASHGHTHVAVTRLEPELLTVELSHSRELIEKHTGYRPLAFMYPLGALNQQAAEEVERAGYQAAFAAQGQLIDTSVDRFKIPRFKMERTTSLQHLAVFFEPGRQPP